MIIMTAANHDNHDSRRHTVDCLVSAYPCMPTAGREPAQRRRLKRHGHAHTRQGARLACPWQLINASRVRARPEGLRVGPPSRPRLSGGPRGAPSRTSEPAQAFGWAQRGSEADRIDPDVRVGPDQAATRNTTPSRMRVGPMRSDSEPLGAHRGTPRAASRLRPTLGLGWSFGLGWSL
jgi:hypothetical protein